MGISTESQKQFAFVIASTVEGEFVRLIDCAYLKLLTLYITETQQIRRNRISNAIKIDLQS